MNSFLQIGKLYRCGQTTDLLGLTDHQYKNNLLPTFLRIEKLYSTGATTFKGKFDMIVLKPNTIIFFLGIEKTFIAGHSVDVVKCLYEDNIIYIPFFQKRKPELHFSLLEQV